MEEIRRLKMKVGLNEFEAEGTEEWLQKQLEAFQALVSSAPNPATYPQFNFDAPVDSGIVAESKVDTPFDEQQLSKIMKLDGRVVSLTAPPKELDAAILLLIYGQKVLRGVDLPNGTAIMDGLSATGGMAITRIDRILERLGENGDLIVTGERRSKRYRLTNVGLVKVRQIAREILATVA
jgi:hypothetical protein